MEGMNEAENNSKDIRCQLKWKGTYLLPCWLWYYYYYITYNGKCLVLSQRQYLKTKQKIRTFVYIEGAKKCIPVMCIHFWHPQLRICNCTPGSNLPLNINWFHFNFPTVNYRILTVKTKIWQMKGGSEKLARNFKYH